MLFLAFFVKEGRMSDLWLSSEFTTSRQCCASCTGCQYSDESTSNWPALSSRHCLARHLRTWLTTYIWSQKGLDAGSARLPTDRVLFHAHTTHSVTGVSLLPGRMSGTPSQQTYVTRTSPTQASCVNLKTYWFSCGRGAMWHSALLRYTNILTELNWTELTAVLYPRP